MVESRLHGHDLSLRKNVLVVPATPKCRSLVRVQAYAVSQAMRHRETGGGENFVDPPRDVARLHARGDHREGGLARLENERNHAFALFTELSAQERHGNVGSIALELESEVQNAHTLGGEGTRAEGRESMDAEAASRSGREGLEARALAAGFAAFPLYEKSDIELRFRFARADGAFDPVHESVRDDRGSPIQGDLVFVFH